MNDTVDKTDKLAKYRSPGQEPAAVKSTATKRGPGKVAYEPYKLSKDSKRYLELRLRVPDPAECPLNSMITNVRGEWRRGLGVSIDYGKSMLVDIKGKNLQELFQAIKEWRVEWIEEFDPRFHLPFTGDEDAPFIKSIGIVTPKTEVAPPMNQRH